MATDKGKADKAKIIAGYFDQLKRRRQPWECDWQEIADFCDSKRTIMYDADSAEGRRLQKGKRAERVFDSTAKTALRITVDGTQGYLMSADSVWFRTVPWDTRYDNEKLRAWFQHVDERIYSELRRSNFYESIAEQFEDGFSIGTSCIYVENDDELQVCCFQPKHPKGLYIMENKYGRVDTVFYRYFISLKSAEERFGDKLPEEARRLLENEGNRLEEIECVHIVLPRSGGIAKEFGAKSRNRKYASFYYFPGFDDYYEAEGYDTMPYIVWRFRTNSDEEYGRSNYHDVLADIKRLQAISKSQMKHAQKATDSPLLVPRELFGLIDHNPGGETPYDNPNKPILPVPGSQGAFPIEDAMIQRIQQQIRQHLKVDFYLMLQAQAGRNMTATEVAERAGERAAVLGAEVGRINSELMDPMFDRIFDIMLANGRIDLPPVAVGEIRLEWLGLLSQLQRRFLGTKGIVDGLNQIAPYLPFWPQAIQKIKGDDVIAEILHQAGFQEKLLVPDDELAKMRQMIAAQQQQQQAIQTSLELAKASGSMSKAPEPGSPLDQLNQASGGIGQ